MPTSSTSSSERSLPRAFGRYMLFDYIGKGGMADIYLARASTDLGGSRLCVVKQILEEFAHHPQFAEMLIHEAKLAARLSHANVVQVFDLGREHEQLFIAMEYVEGFDLNALLRRCSKQKVPLPLEFAIHVVVSALRGLDYAHRRTDDQGRPLGVVHRDVSPSNILVSFDGDVKVCDFGIAHANDVVAAGGATADEAIKGKAGYMSPEHARGEVIDARADVFAAGIVLWELLAGRRLYKSDAASAARGTGGRSSLLEQARRAQIPQLPMRGLTREVELHEIVKRALAFDKNDRYASAGAMLRDLESWATVAAKVASPLKLGEWLTTNFGVDVIDQRRMRERAAAALARGPLVVLTPLASTNVPEPPRTSKPPTVASQPPPPDDFDDEEATRIKEAPRVSPELRAEILGAQASTVASPTVAKAVAEAPASIASAITQIEEMLARSAPSAPAPPVAPSFATAPPRPPMASEEAIEISHVSDFPGPAPPPPISEPAPSEPPRSMAPTELAGSAVASFRPISVAAPAPLEQLDEPRRGAGVLPWFLFFVLVFGAVAAAAWYFEILRF